MVDVFGDVSESTVEKHENISALNHFIAGWVGGSAGIVVGHPIDTVKVQVQMSESKSTLRNTVTSVRNFGWSHGFYRGVSFPLASQGVLCAMFFAGYGYTLETLRRRWPDAPDSVRAFVAGCVGGAVQLVPCCPIEIVKCNLQAHLSKEGPRYFNGPLDCLKSIYRERGLKGCFRGFGIHAHRDIIGYGIYTAAEVQMLSSLKFLDTSHALSPGCFLIGGLAGSISWLIVTPFDVVKSRIQARDLRFSITQFFGFVFDIYRNEGFRAFFKGGAMSVARAFPVNVVTLPLYHYCETSLKAYV